MVEWWSIAVHSLRVVLVAMEFRRTLFFFSYYAEILWRFNRWPRSSCEEEWWTACPALPSSAPPPPSRLATVQPSISRGDQLQIQIPIATCHNIFLYSANMHPVLSHSFAAAHERTDGRQLDFLYHGGEKDSNRIESVSLHLRCCSQAGRNLYSSLALFFLSAVERPTRSAMSGDWMASNRVQQQQ